jgi:glutamate/tyrosine decarboxylase-like PLP-dependent enzyme
MTGFDEYSAVLGDAAKYAEDWLTGLPTRRVPPIMNSDEVADAIGRSLPEGPTDPRAVIALLAQSAEPGLTAMGSPRFFGFVIGGATPAALAADWLTSTWDQNAGLRQVTPAAAALSDAAARWLLDLWGLPSGCSVGFVTGATMANFSGLAAARHRVLDRVGWNVGEQGLFGAPRIDVIVGDEVHESVVSALRYLGLGAPRRVAVDDQGRISLKALVTALDECAGPTIVVLQAGNIHSGAFDPFDDAIAVAHEHGAWVHVDGAFGLWAAASADLRASSCAPIRSRTTA